MTIKVVDRKYGEQHNSHNIGSGSLIQNPFKRPTAEEAEEKYKNWINLCYKHVPEINDFINSLVAVYVRDGEITLTTETAWQGEIIKKAIEKLAKQ